MRSEGISPPKHSPRSRPARNVAARAGPCYAKVLGHEREGERTLRANSSVDSDLQALCAGTALSPSAKRVVCRLTSASTGLDVSYTAAWAVTWADDFLPHISAAARHAKRARQLLQDLAHMNYVRPETARELIHEARGLEAILVASRNTARRRRDARQRGALAAGRFAKNPCGAGR